MTRFLQILTKTIISSLDPNSSVINSFFFVSLPVSYPFNFNTFHQTSFFIKCNAFFFTKQTYYSICMLNNYIVIPVQLIIIAKITRIRLNNSTRITLKMCTFHRKKILPVEYLRQQSLPLVFALCLNFLSQKKFVPLQFYPKTHRKKLDYVTNYNGICIKTNKTKSL